MSREPEVSAIFNPRRARAPSVVVSDADARHNGPFANIAQIHHADSVASSQHDASDCQTDIPEPHGSNGGIVHQFQLCRKSCCSELAQKMYFGICVTVLLTASWVGSTHCIKYLYLRLITSRSLGITEKNQSVYNSNIHTLHYSPYNAPFFTTWFCTNFSILFFPIYIIGRMIRNKCDSPNEIISESLRNFREKGFTAARFLTRCSLFCLLWVATTYMYLHSLRILLATDAMALFATNVSCVYLLSWVILHEQFVGVRIVAVILCDTGIALLAYMDGITSSPTLGGVVLAASAAAGYAVYKVLFRKVIGDATYGQVSLFFSMMGIINASLMWPLCLTLYLTGVETLSWERLSWPILLAASGMFLAFNLLSHFGKAVTYELFITLGLITAVPVSAALDVVLYGAHFAGMKLAGMILIAVGFFLVMFPDNWPDYITRLLRNIIMLSHSARPAFFHHRDIHLPTQDPFPS
ncbi:solute carrier family 35 member F3 [Arctopsyche grandis]|uniref:solute carrier family 35 member F3 n=1 Tax=Arctopsyche grandis TaxID=121162 RepID=UPI00406D7DCE